MRRKSYLLERRIVLEADHAMVVIIIVARTLLASRKGKVERRVGHVDVEIYTCA